MRLFVQDFTMRTTVILVFALVLQPLLAQQPARTHWAVSYSHQDARFSLRLVEIRFADERHGVAVGWLARAGRPERSDQTEPAALMTADGGKSWNLVPL